MKVKFRMNCYASGQQSLLCCLEIRRLCGVDSFHVLVRVESPSHLEKSCCNVSLDVSAPSALPGGCESSVGWSCGYGYGCDCD